MHILLHTYSMVQSPFWEANWFAASQEIPRISQNPKVHYRTHNVCHLSLSWASPIQSIYPHPTSWRTILILPTHLRLGLPSGLLPSSFTIKAPPPHPYAPHAQPISFFSILSPAQYWVRSTDHLAPCHAVSSIPPITSSMHILHYYFYTSTNHTSWPTKCLSSTSGIVHPYLALMHCRSTLFLLFAFWLMVPLKLHFPNRCIILHLHFLHSKQCQYKWLEQSLQDGIG